MTNTQDFNTKLNESNNLDENLIKISILEHELALSDIQVDKLEKSLLKLNQILDNKEHLLQRIRTNGIFTNKKNKQDYKITKLIRLKSKDSSDWEIGIEYQSLDKNIHHTFVRSGIDFFNKFIPSGH